MRLGFRRASLLVVLAACAPAPPERAHVWTVSSLLSEDDDVGGFDPHRLVVKSGATVPWTGADYGTAVVTAANDAVVVQPAWAEGQPSAYVVTEVWENHPDPWVQPVYLFVGPYDATMPFAHKLGYDPLFGVGTESTFYSPFWRFWFAEPGDAVGPFTEVGPVTKFPMHKGSLILCPIVPDEVTVSSAARPLSGEALLPTSTAHAYANGQRVSYLNLGTNRQDVNVYEESADGTVTADDLYVFVKLQPDGSRTSLELPAVLPDDARHHAYLRRIDVVLDAQPVFVPAGLTALRARLKVRGVNVPDADPAIADDVARANLLRVAADGGCFASAAAFPSGCSWLDSESAIDATFPASKQIETDVTLTATAVLLP